MNHKDYVLKVVPKYAVLPLISAFVLNMAVYAGTMALCGGFYHHDFTTAFDRAVPLIPEFTSIFLGCQLHNDRKDRKRAYVPFPDRGLPLQDHLRPVLCISADHTGPPGNHRKRILGSGSETGLFSGSVGKPVSVYSLPGKLVLLCGNPESERDSKMVSEIFSDLCGSCLYFHTGYKAALHY